MFKLASFISRGRNWAWCGFLGLGLYAAHAQYIPDWTQQVRIGALVGFNIRADFSMSGQFPISGSQPGPAGVSGVDHFYDDGYVRVDQTGNAQGYTSFWGYNNASQYRAADQALLMHSASSYSASAGSSKDDSPYFGFDVAYGANPWRWGQTRLGFEFGFGFLPLKIHDNQLISATIQRQIYAFNTAGILLPTAPYHGGSSGIGPTIRDVAIAQPGDVTSGTVTGPRLDATLYTFRLGPSLYWDVSRRFALGVAAGPAVGVVPGELKFNETITLSDGTVAHNQGQAGATKITFGGYVSATAMVHVVPRGDLYVGAQFMPMGTATFESGGRESRLKLDGALYVSGGIHWSF